MLTPCVANGGASVFVGYEEPDITLIDGNLSKQYMIEYQTKDLPTLAEGDAVVLTLPVTGSPSTADVSFVVREPAVVPENPAFGSNGFYRRALLTKP